MGLYINPRGQSKEDWLKENGHPSSLSAVKAMRFSEEETELPVCLVDNGFCTAAAVGFDPRELAEFSRPDDLRPKEFFVVSKEKLKAVCPDYDRYFKK